MENLNAEKTGTQIAVTYRETLSRTFIVSSDRPITPDEAIEKIRGMVDDGEIVLDCEDTPESEIDVSDTFPNGIVPEDRDVSYYEQVKY